MKLIFCNECKDVLSLRNEEKQCYCGKSKGKYIDDETVEYSGPCRVLSIVNRSFAAALNYKQPNGNTKGIVFKSFVVPYSNGNVKRTEAKVE